MRRYLSNIFGLCYWPIVWLLALCVLASEGYSALKPLPQGIYFYENVSSTSSHQDPTTWPCWTAPELAHLHGVLGRETWEEYEPSEGVYNDSIFFGVIASKCATAGLQYEIQIQNNGQLPNGDSLYPQWVITAGAKTMVVHDNSGSPVTIVIPGNSVYKAKLQAMLTHLASVYESDPNCRAVQMTGPGRSPECVFCGTAADWTWLEGQGGGTVDGGEDKWESWAEAIGAFYAAGFVTTHFEYASGAPVISSVDPNNVTFQNVVTAMQVSYNGSGVRFGTSDHGYYLGAKSHDYGTGLQIYQQNQKVGSPGAGNEAIALLGNDPGGIPYNAKAFQVTAADCALSGNYTGFDNFNANAP